MKIVSFFIIATFFLVASVYCETDVRPFLFTTSPFDSDDRQLNLQMILRLMAGLEQNGIFAGGYVFRPTVTDRSSAADRFFGTNRLAVQISVGREF